MISLALLMATAPTAACDLSTATSMQAVHNAFAHRAVEVMTLASADDVAKERRLTELIDPSAAFVLGSGDVGLPLGKGASGARAMARRINADQYRFLGWDYMDGPANGCSKGEIEVEFLDSARGATSQVKFTFENGRIVATSGWQRTYETGRLTRPSGN